jgi:hypothetical protein
VILVDKLREVLERAQQQPEERQNDISEMAQRESDWSQ